MITFASVKLYCLFNLISQIANFLSPRSSNSIVSIQVQTFSLNMRNIFIYVAWWWKKYLLELLTKNFKFTCFINFALIKAYHKRSTLLIAQVDWRFLLHIISLLPLLPNQSFWYYAPSTVVSFWQCFLSCTCRQFTHSIGIPCPKKQGYVTELLLCFFLGKKFYKSFYWMDQPFFYF